VKREVGKGEGREVKGWGGGVRAICVGLKKKQQTTYSTFLTGCCLPYCTCCLLSCLVYIYVSFMVFVCIVVSWIVCRVLAVWCILWSPYVYSLSVYLWCGVFVGLGICCTVCCVFVVLWVLMFLL
jgi:hypothetical protein